MLLVRACSTYTYIVCVEFSGYPLQPQCTYAPTPAELVREDESLLYPIPVNRGCSEVLYTLEAYNTCMIYMRRVWI